MRPQSGFYGDGDLLPVHVQLHGDDGPGSPLPQHGLIEFEVTHRSAPPFEEPSIAQQKSVTQPSPEEPFFFWFFWSWL
jgi:hypothetical protein